MKRHRARNLLVGDQTLFAVGGEKGLGMRLGWRGEGGGCREGGNEGGR